MPDRNDRNEATRRHEACAAARAKLHESLNLSDDNWTVDQDLERVYREIANLKRLLADARKNVARHIRTIAELQELVGPIKAGADNARAHAYRESMEGVGDAT